MRKNKPSLLLILFIIFLFSLVLSKNFTGKVAQHFSLMAEAFNHGQLSLMRVDPVLGNHDIFFHNGKPHWANFPFPALPLMPFVFIFEKFGLFFYQGYLQFFLTIGVFFVSYLLARKFKFTNTDSLFLATAFCFGSNYSFLAFYSDSWYYSQVVAVLALLLALYEWYTKKRLVVVGVLLGALIASRATAGMVTVFFALSILQEGITKESLRKIFTLTFPIILTCVLLLGYNQARFGNPWETGYTDENIGPDYQVTMLERHGTFKFENIPTNIYWNFLAPPEPIFENDTYHLIPPFFKVNGLGLSFFLMSPLFILIFKTLKNPKKDELCLWIGSIATLIPLLMWYSTGFWQVGARYLLDLFPLWYILLLYSIKDKNLLKWQKLVIVLSSLLNLFWVLPTFIPPSN